MVVVKENVETRLDFDRVRGARSTEEYILGVVASMMIKMVTFGRTKLSFNNFKREGWGTGRAYYSLPHACSKSPRGH
jgi:hypothetical protein